MVAYALADGHGNYIRHDVFSGKYVPVRSESLAEKWEQRAKAQNILKNALNKKDRKRFHIIDVDDTSIFGIPKSVITVTEPDEVNEENFHIEKVKELAEPVVDDNQMDKWTAGLSTVTEFIQDAEERRDKLSQSLSDIDKEITDIQHYIELNDLSPYKLFLTCRMLQCRLRIRRRIKNELTVLNQLGDCKMDSSLLIDMQNAINDLDNRTYTPRILTELFD